MPSDQRPSGPDEQVEGRHVIVVASGGLDSTILAYSLANDGAELTLVSFDYGQRHRIELDHAAEVAQGLGSLHHVVDLSSVGRLLSGSALTDAEVAVPDGHYTHASMRSTVVPNRNAIMLDIAVGVAVAAGADAVAFGAHAGDHPIYPDCRPGFVEAFARAARLGNEGFASDRFEVMAPFLTLTKAEIVGIGAALGVPFARTWSCYRGESVHCGTCGTCTERREAFTVAGVPDPTEYLR